MKLIIQIPCYNEEKTLPVTIAALPEQVSGFDTVEILVIDDGSTDRTSEIAKNLGVTHIVRHKQNKGLAAAFMTGINACIKLGADVIVNTDADNQYNADDIPKLTAPILSGNYEIVIGARPIAEISHFSMTKKLLQRLGSKVVSKVGNVDISDAPSGFRAISRQAAQQLHLFNEYTYTLETIIQAGKKGIAITHVPIKTNENLRPSRLIKGIPTYILKSFSTIVRIFMTYKPFRFFAVPGLLFFSLGFLIGLRYLYFVMIQEGTGHIQSVILASLLMGTGFFLCMIGLLADLISVNRKLLEKIDWKICQLEETVYSKNEQPDG